MYQQRYISSDATPGRLWRPLCNWPTRARTPGSTRALLGGTGARAAGGPLRIVHRPRRRAARLHEPRPPKCSRRPRRRYDALVLDQARRAPRPSPLVAIDVHTGALVAMVGGSISPALQFNLATQGRWGTGSAFKPFVLVAALERGISPERAYDPAGGPWQLLCGRALADLGQGPRTPRKVVRAPGRSRSAPTPWPRPRADMGITTPLGGQPVTRHRSGRSARRRHARSRWPWPTPRSPAAAQRLSAQRGRSTLSKAGFPVTIVKVTDAEGELLDENGVVRSRVIDPGIAELVTTLPAGRHDRTAPGRAADIGRPAAGTDRRLPTTAGAPGSSATRPDLVTAVWVGYPDGATLPAHATSWAGSKAAVRRRADAAQPVTLRWRLPGADLGRLHDRSARRHPRLRLLHLDTPPSG